VEDLTAKLATRPKANEILLRDQLRVWRREDAHVGLIVWPTSGEGLFERGGVVWPLKVSITLPSCATLIGAPVTSGLTAQNHVAAAGKVVTITGPLTMDAQVQINYACAATTGALAGQSLGGAR
jgi:hypothetical protein